jgi:hypothetical protein
VSLGTFVVAALSAMGLLDAAARWYHSRDVDLIEGDELPPYKVAVWGTYRLRADYEPRSFRYFQMKLPSYEYTYSMRRREMEWHQRALQCFNGKWHLRLYPVE